MHVVILVFERFQDRKALCYDRGFRSVPGLSRYLVEKPDHVIPVHDLTLDRIAIFLSCWRIYDLQDTVSYYSISAEESCREVCVKYLP